MTRLRWTLAVVAAAGLAVDAYIHFDLAGNYDPIKTSTISQGTLFRIEAVAAVIAGVLVLVRQNRWTAGFAFLVAAAGTAAILVYRYVDVGKIGPLPNMYEPVWYAEKTRCVYAMVVAALASAALLVVTWSPLRAGSRRPTLER